ncbi:MAG: hypothetical protein ABI467_13985 [Kofleriaceae bacterium]
MLVRASLVSVMLLACKAGNPPPPPARTDLIVVSPGVLPRRVLRYHLAKGTKTTFELDLEGTLVAGEITSASPPLTFALSIAVDDVLPDGRMKLATTVLGMTAHAASDQPGAPRANADAAALAGLVLTATLSPDGTIADVHVASAAAQDSGSAAAAQDSGSAALAPGSGSAAPGPLDASARALIDQLVQALPKLAMPLPPTPVGIGAKWRSARSLGPISPLALTSVTTIDLDGISGSTLTYELTSTVHGDDQHVTQDGVEVQVKDITGTATGHGTFDLAKLAPLGTLAAELHMEMTTGSDRTPMTMSLEMRSH